MATLDLDFEMGTETSDSEPASEESSKEGRRTRRLVFTGVSLGLLGLFANVTANAAGGANPTHAGHADELADTLNAAAVSSRGPRGTELADPRPCTYTVKASTSGLYLTAKGTDSTGEVDIQLCNNGTSPGSQWRFWNISPGTFTLESVHASGMYMDLAKSGKFKGTKLMQLYKDPGSTHAQWQIFQYISEPTNYFLRNVASGEFLSGDGASLNSNVQVISTPSGLEATWRLDGVDACATSTTTPRTTMLGSAG